MGPITASPSANASWCSEGKAQGLDLRKEEQLLMLARYSTILSNLQTHISALK